ncbi:MAG: hypothetical protein ACLQF1_00905 [Methyloceanibacter sp.]|jgi:hypothetical protein
MAIILQFPRVAESTPRVMERADCILGQIIIFPGVRIDRRASEGTPSGTATSSGKRAQRSRKKQR